MVDGTQFVPKGDKLPFEYGTALDREVLEELLDCFFLLFIKGFVIVHQILQVLQVTEEFVRIYQVFIYIVEIADEQLAPKIEVVQCFLTFCFFTEYFI